MTWRPPRYGYQHELRDVLRNSQGVGLSFDPGGNGGSLQFGSSTDYLWDDRGAQLAQFTPETDRVIVWLDRAAAGAVAPFSPIGRLWIPEGGNFTRVRVRSNPNTPQTADGATISHGWGPTITPGAVYTFDLVDGLLGTDDTNRYINFELDNGGTAAPLQCGEVMFTTMYEPVRGPVQGWTDDKEANRLSFEKESKATFSIALGADARRLVFRYIQISDLADRQFFETFLDTVSTYLPFLLDPPYTTDPQGVAQQGLWVKFDLDPRRSEDTPRPAEANSVVYKGYEFDMLEHMG